MMPGKLKHKSVKNALAVPNGCSGGLPAPDSYNALLFATVFIAERYSHR
jgi:hypothetical protein